MTQKRLFTGLLLGIMMCVLIPNAFATSASVQTSKIISSSEVQITFDVPIDWSISDFSNLSINSEARTIDSISETAPSSTVTISFSGGSAVGIGSSGTIDIGVIAVGGSGNDFAGVTGLSLTDDRVAPINHGGSSSTWKLKPTFGMDWLKSERVMVNNGVIWNNQRYDVTNNWWTPFPKQIVNTDEEQNLSMTVYSPKGLAYGAFYLGVPSVGKSNESQIKVTVTKDNTVTLEQKVNLITITKTRVETVKCNEFNNLQCDRISIQYRFNESPKFDVFAFQAVDLKRQETTTYLNEGFKVIGNSINPPDEKFVVTSDSNHRGLVHVVSIDRWNNMWKSDDGYIYKENESGSFIWQNSIDIVHKFLKDNPPEVRGSG